jgi:murein DD-endopeptidase MepM/ murein hydrolase activator NlpD
MTPDDRNLLLLGAGAALVYRMMNSTQVSPAWGQGWVWPIPDLLMAPPLAASVIPATISQEFRGRDAASPHFGVDLMYRSAGGDKSWLDGASWFAPAGTPVCAAKSGTVWSVDLTPRGWAIVLDHTPPWATFYQHLDAVNPRISRGAVVKAGDQLGTMGADPTDAEHVRHLHFAAWYHGAGDAASVDPAEAMQGWARWQWHPPDSPI